MSIAVPVGLAFLSSLLLWLAFFPVNCCVLGWVALTPLLILVRLQVGPSIRQRLPLYLLVWLSGLGFFVAAIAWMRVGDPMMYYAWLALSFHCSLFVLLAFTLLRCLDRRSAMPLCVSTPIIWTAVEYLRGWILGGFPWYFLGHTQHDVLTIIQIADIGGVYLVTFLLAAANGLLADALTGRRSHLWLSTILLAVAMTASLVYGAWRMSQNRFESGPKVSLLQGNTPQGVKNDSGSESGQAAAAKMINEHSALMDLAMADRPDIVIWPETSYPGVFTFPAAGVPESEIALWTRQLQNDRSRLSEAGVVWKTPVLLGVITSDVGPGERHRQFNSAVLVDGGGVIRGRYNKIHRVPFGEYVPLVETFPWLKNLTPYDGLDYVVQAGTVFTRFDINTSKRNYRFGTLICYEDSESALARAYVDSDPVDFLVNISNDGWFKGTQEHEQHLAICRFRAIECRRTVVRAVNMGVSAVIDPNGRVPHMLGSTWAKSKAVGGVVSANVPIDHRWSFYAATGDWLPMGCLLIVGFHVLKGMCPWWKK